MSGPAIARHVRQPLFTVGFVLRRCGLGRLTALNVRPPILRYERERPGELIHIDIKKLGRINRIGHRITGDRSGQSNGRGIGWEYLHVTIDDRSRLAYTQLLPTERKEDATAFFNSRPAWFSSHGLAVSILNLLGQWQGKRLLTATKTVRWLWRRPGRWRWWPRRRLT